MLIPGLADAPACERGSFGAALTKEDYRMALRELQRFPDIFGPIAAWHAHGSRPRTAIR
jgi:hypothetical protein